MKATKIATLLFAALCLFIPAKVCAQTNQTVACIVGTHIATCPPNASSGIVGVFNLFGGSTTSMITSGTATVNLATSALTNNGDYACTNSSGGTVVDNGILACPAGQQVGLISQTNFSAVSSVLVNLTTTPIAGSTGAVACISGSSIVTCPSNGTNPVGVIQAGGILTTVNTNGYANANLLTSANTVLGDYACLSGSTGTIVDNGQSGCASAQQVGFIGQTNFSPVPNVSVFLTTYAGNQGATGPQGPQGPPGPATTSGLGNQTTVCDLTAPKCNGTNLPATTELGALFNACSTDLPATGGTCDARGLTSPVTWSTNITNLKYNVTYIMPVGTINRGTGVQWVLNHGWIHITSPISGLTASFIVSGGSDTSSVFGSTLVGGFELDHVGFSGGVAGSYQLNINVTQSSIHDIAVNGPGLGINMPGSGCVCYNVFSNINAYNITIQGNTNWNDWFHIVAGSSTLSSSYYAFDIQSGYLNSISGLSIENTPKSVHVSSSAHDNYIHNFNLENDAIQGQGVNTWLPILDSGALRNKIDSKVDCVNNSGNNSNVCGTLAQLPLQSFFPGKFVTTKISDPAAPGASAHQSYYGSQPLALLPAGANFTGSSYTIEAWVNLFLPSYPAGLPSRFETISDFGNAPRLISISASANASAGNTIYTGVMPAGCSSSSYLTGVVFSVAGFSNSQNNGNFTAVSCSSTTLTLNNSSGVAESTAASATSQIADRVVLGIDTQGMHPFLEVYQGGIPAFVEPATVTVTAGALNQVVVVWDSGTGKATFYTNGTVDSASETIQAPLNVTRSTNGLGSSSCIPCGNDQSLYGDLMEFAIFPSALSSGTIGTHYTDGTNPSGNLPADYAAASPTAYYRLNDAPSTITLTAAGAASGNSTVYTGSNVPAGCASSSSFLTNVTGYVTGFTSSGNNSAAGAGPFVVTSCSATTITLTNPNGTIESHSGTFTYPNVVTATNGSNGTYSGAVTLGVASGVPGYSTGSGFSAQLGGTTLWAYYLWEIDPNLGVTNVSSPGYAVNFSTLDASNYNVVSPQAGIQGILKYTMARGANNTCFAQNFLFSQFPINDNGSWPTSSCTPPTGNTTGAMATPLNTLDDGAGNMTVAGDVSVATGKGFKINSTATSSHYLRGNGTRYVDSAIQVGDLPASATITTPIITLGSTAVGSTLSPTCAAQSGQQILVGASTGEVVTLPTPAVGCNFEFIITVSNTSNYNEIQTGSAQFLLGEVQHCATGIACLDFWADGSTIRALKMDGAHLGGLVGSHFWVKGISSTQWEIYGSNLGTSVMTTGFTTTP